MGYTCAVHTHRQGTAMIGAQWSHALREAIDGDPEWERFVASLSPGMPLNAALASFVSQLKAWVAATDEEARDAKMLLARIEAGSIEDPEAFFTALEGGQAVRPPAGAKRPRRPARAQRGAA